MRESCMCACVSLPVCFIARVCGSSPVCMFHSPFVCFIASVFHRRVHVFHRPCVSLPVCVSLRGPMQPLVLLEPFRLRQNNGVGQRRCSEQWGWPAPLFSAVVQNNDTEQRRWSPPIVLAQPGCPSKILTYLNQKLHGAPS